MPPRTRALALALAIVLTASGCVLDATESSWSAVEPRTSLADDLVLGLGDDGGSFLLLEGARLVVRLPWAPTSGVFWRVTRMDRAFPAPEVELPADGMIVLTWPTAGLSGLATPAEAACGPPSSPSPFRFELEAARPDDPAALLTFGFDLTVVPAPAEAELALDPRCDGRAASVVEGNDILVRLPGPQRRDRVWVVARVDRSFGDAEITLEPPTAGSAEAAPTTSFRWSTRRGVAIVDGPYAFALEARARAGAPDEDALGDRETMTFSVWVLPASARREH